MKLNTNKPVLEFKSEEAKLTESLSGAVIVGEHLWVASDELVTIERLTNDNGNGFNQHQSFELKDLIHLPAGTGDNSEIDIEGLEHNNSYLWLVGSHSIKRKKPEKGKTTEKNLERLATTEIDGNRFLLARIPLNASGELKSEMPDADNPQTLLKAAQLAGDIQGNELTDAIRSPDPGDRHFAEFLSIPGKDNGFDIEGLAIKDDRIFLGLRGPVLRGWAGILEVSVSEEESSPLKLRAIGPNGRRYKKHFLELGGLGVRDLCVVDSDMLILAGPTMNLDGPVVVFRWPNAFEGSGDQLIFAGQLQKLFKVDNGVGTDHAEGMALLTDGDSKKLLIVFDSPSGERRVSEQAVRADVFDLPSV
jgi:Protein of unknown function (DUF3616)